MKSSTNTLISLALLEIPPFAFAPRSNMPQKRNVMFSILDDLCSLP